MTSTKTKKPVRRKHTGQPGNRGQFAETASAEPSALNLDHDPVIHVTCRKCRGTGSFDTRTRYREEDGSAFCFACRGRGYKETTEQKIADDLAAKQKWAELTTPLISAGRDTVDTSVAILSDADADIADALNTELDEEEAATNSPTSVRVREAWSAVSDLTDGANINDVLENYRATVDEIVEPTLLGPNTFEAPCDVCGSIVPANSGTAATFETISSTRFSSTVTYCKKHPQGRSLD